MVTPVERFRAMLRIATVSKIDESEVDRQQFDMFVAELQKLYPAIHAALELEIVAGHSMLYRWPGTSTARPSILMAHYDVVATVEDRWEYPPFDARLTGEGEEQLIWSRGTIDDKGALVAILEAVERQIAEGFVPANDLYLSFGHDEETSGTGARAIVGLLERRGVRPAFVLDEGGAIVEGIFPGVDLPIAVIGVSEKGIASVDLTVIQSGGHASTPPRFSATTRLARAIVRVDARPFPSEFTAVNLEMIRTVGANARQPYRWVFTNLWLTRAALLRLFRRLGDETAAMTRTTAVVTTLRASDAENALAESATATINLRVAVGSSLNDAIAHIRRSVRDPKVIIEARNTSEPSPVSPTTGWAWDLLRSTVDATYPGTVVTPYIQLGASDSRHFTTISEHVYRFTPFELSLEERETLHAANERIHVATWLRGIDFYERIILGL